MWPSQLTLGQRITETMPGGHGAYFLHARRSDNNMVKQLLFATRIPGHVQPVGWPCGTWMHYAMRDVKDMGQQMGYRSLDSE